MVDLDPVLEHHLPFPPCLPLVLPVIFTYMWLNNPGMIREMISLLEISCIFPLVAVDVNELLYLCIKVKGWSIDLVTAILDGESQTAKELMDYIL